MAADSSLRYLAIANMIEGCIVVLLQLAVLITLHDWVDWICIGFWGGGLMVLAGMWALQRSKKKMIPTAALAILGALCMIGFYSWNVSVIDCDDYDRPDKSKGNWEEENPELCQWRVASDILFIIFGCLAVATNMFMAAKASMIVGRHPRRSSHSSHYSHHPRPAAHTMAHVQPPVAVHHHTTYVTPTATYPAPYPDQHQMVPTYPPQQVSYPAYPGQPSVQHQAAYNPGYPAPQAPPYYKN
uniref:Transmembrane protein n=1 Tax=Daphnia magna TaxID=35525 RepID=A0A0P5RTL6_9CRUS